MPVSLGVLVGVRVGRVSWGPTLPPLTWRVYPAECAQSHKTAHLDTGARLMERAADAKQILAKPILANPFWDLVCVMVGPWRVGPRRWMPNPRKKDPEEWGPKGEAEGWALRVGPKGGGPKISRFFSVSRSHFRSFCLSLGVFSWNFGGVWVFWKAPGPSNVHVENS